MKPFEGLVLLKSLEHSYSSFGEIRLLLNDESFACQYVTSMKLVLMIIGEQKEEEHLAKVKERDVDCLSCAYSPRHPRKR